MMALLALLASTSTASAPDLDELETSETSTAPDPLRYAKYAAIVDGGWSVALTAAWGLGARSYDAPYPDGILAIGFARILYGTTWSILLTSEVALARVVAGSSWSGMSKGAFKNNWLYGFEVPGRCGDRGSTGGVCGAGLGSFGEISALVSSELPIRAALTGGWIQGRYYSDQQRTIIESTWIQSPIGVWYEPRFEAGPLTLELSVGPGWWWGMHNAHVHPKPHVKLPPELEVPFYELIPLHYGTGPGVHGGVGIVFYDAIALTADAELSFFILGGSNYDAREKVAPLVVFDARGLPIWRKASAGIRFTLDAIYPLVLSAKVVVCELSARGLDSLGHVAAGIQFEVPIELDDE